MIRPIHDEKFVDANVFVYSFAEDPQFGKSCTDFLDRIKVKDLQGFISAAAFSGMHATRLFGFLGHETLRR